MKITVTGFVTLILYSLLRTGCAQQNRVTGSQGVGNRQRNSCGLTKFRCNNGDCIANELLCDGRPDCSDESDETQLECTKPSIVCSVYAFRCAYGACIDGDKTCNGIKDCVDNSDETLPRCGNNDISTSNNGTSSPCRSEDQFRCNNDDCINKDNLCDGIPHCTDRSDETVAQCGSLTYVQDYLYLYTGTCVRFGGSFTNGTSYSCPQTVFRCSYGACIDGNLKCNNEIDCADGSDEDPELCNAVTSTTSRRPPVVTPERRTTTSTTPIPWTPSRPTRKPCQVPSQPEEGQWLLHRSQCQSGNHCRIQQNVYQLEPGTYLIYSCNVGYKLKGSADVFCGPEGKWLNIPTCEEIRCKGLNTVSTDALCTYNNEWTSCESSVLPGTVAKLTCRNSYRQDTSLLTRQRDNVRCNAKGQWEPEPIRCVPVCGVVSSATTPLIVNGTRPNITDFPWHATLYRAESQRSEKDFICGATIIQDNLLITAAHCVYDEGKQAVDDADKFYVMTGNYFRDYDSPLHDQRIVKKGKVKNVYIICSYLGFDGNYAWDIAILELVQPFVFSAFLVPICLDSSSFGDQSVLEPGSYGRVAGFGRTAMGPSSFVLQAITVPYIPLNQCKSASSTSENEKFITIDKFCAGYTNGSSVCDGDSGGGLVFKTGGLWYLRGIVSVGIGATMVAGSRSCDSHSYSLYTRISNHVSWIQDVILKLEMYGSFPSCPAARS